MEEAERKLASYGIYPRRITDEGKTKLFEVNRKRIPHKRLILEPSSEGG